MGEAHIVVGLGFGDEGKGSIVDFLCEQSGAQVVVRFNGGPQAAHHVVRDGVEHTFAQFGAGTLIPGVRTHLSRFMLINPLNLVIEANHLIKKGVTDVYDRLTIDGHCRIITPYHVQMNRYMEKIRAASTGIHGSCGEGVGDAVKDSFDGHSIFAYDILSPKHLEDDLVRTHRRKYEETVALVEAGKLGQEAADWFHEIPSPKEIAEWYVEILDPLIVLSTKLDPTETVVFEGAQGVLLDEIWGFAPHHTWSDTTTRNAQMILKENRWECDVTTTGVMRAYMTRHGAGPFPTYDADLTAALDDRTNPENQWQGKLLAGYPDMNLYRYALRANNGVDQLAITCLDRVEDTGIPWKVCNFYEEHPTCLSYGNWVGMESAVPVYEEMTVREWMIGLYDYPPVRIESHGPDAGSKRFTPA